MLLVACLALYLVTLALHFVGNPLYSVRDSLQLAPEVLPDVRPRLLLARLALQLVAPPLHSVRSRLQIASGALLDVRLTLLVARLTPYPFSLPLHSVRSPPRSAGGRCTRQEPTALRQEAAALVQTRFIGWA